MADGKIMKGSSKYKKIEEALAFIEFNKRDYRNDKNRDFFMSVKKFMEEKGYITVKQYEAVERSLRYNNE